MIKTISQAIDDMAVSLGASPYKTIDGVDIYMNQNMSELYVEGFAESEFTVTVPADTIEFYRATSDVVEAFGDNALISTK